MAKSYQYAVEDVNGLDDDQIRAVVPSAFALEAHESRSSRYVYVPTIEVLRALRQEGFVPTSAMQARSRVPGKQDYTRHLLRLRRVDDLGITKPDTFEIIIVNAHDGTAAWEIMGGVYRLVCKNGQIVGEIKEQMKVYHKGNAESTVSDVIEGTYRILDDSEEVMDNVAEMQNIELSRPEQVMFSQIVLDARLGKHDDNEDTTEQEEEEQPTKALALYHAEDFLRIRRREDRARDVYTTLNVVQENIMRGGISRYDTKGRRHSTREIHNIPETVKVNKMLWQFAQGVAAMKQGKLTLDSDASITV